MSRTTLTKDPSGTSLPTINFSSKPRVVLHSTPDSNSPLLATAQFHSFSRPIHIDVWSKSGVTANRMESNGGVFGGVDMIFSTYMAKIGRQEVFEWKRSQGTEVRSLG
ncbi:hypothetical protein BKA61DRAFT_603363 [Leptodontidium sp. MPI-SDFR-AT-0119]|nr:hypothetical protein BKA61DRAFT_603363 [Leptodontidium sp. MPI-SDFR-AT-0119]